MRKVTVDRINMCILTDVHAFEIKRPSKSLYNMCDDWHCKLYVKGDTHIFKLNDSSESTRKDFFMRYLDFALSDVDIKFDLVEEWRMAKNEIAGIPK